MSQKQLRGRRALALDYLRMRGAIQVRERVAHSNHLLIEFEHGGRRHVVTFSGNESDVNIDRYVIADIRRVLGPGPKEAKKPTPSKSLKNFKPPRADERASSHHEAANTTPRPKYRPRFRDELNAMTAILRERFASNAGAPS